MGIGYDYFEALELDYTMEVSTEGDLENRRRLLYLVKAGENGAAMTLLYATSWPYEFVAVSAEFTSLTGWTLEDMQTITAEEFWVPATVSIADIHSRNHLCAPWVGQIYKKSGAELAVEVKGISLTVDDKIWRALIFAAYP